MKRGMELTGAAIGLTTAIFVTGCNNEAAPRPETSQAMTYNVDATHPGLKPEITAMQKQIGPLAVEVAMAMPTDILIGNEGYSVKLKLPEDPRARQRDVVFQPNQQRQGHEGSLFVRQQTDGYSQPGHSAGAMNAYYASYGYCGGLQPETFPKINLSPDLYRHVKERVCHGLAEAAGDAFDHIPYPDYVSRVNYSNSDLANITSGDGTPVTFPVYDAKQYIALTPS